MVWLVCIEKARKPTFLFSTHLGQTLVNGIFHYQPQNSQLGKAMIVPVELSLQSSWNKYKDGQIGQLLIFFSVYSIFRIWASLDFDHLNWSSEGDDDMPSWIAAVSVFNVVRERVLEVGPSSDNGTAKYFQFKMLCVLETNLQPWSSHVPEAIGILYRKGY